MEKHFLVTVSEQHSTHYGIRFLGGFFAGRTDLRITLFYTAPKPPARWEGESGGDSARLGVQMVKGYEGKGRRALGDGKKQLIKMGFREDQVWTKFQVRRVSKVADILQEGGQGSYDAVVLGRRGLSWLEEAFDESVSKEILEKKATFPLWVCRHPEEDRKNLLLCADGSDGANRAADHVGFILSNEKSHGVTVFTVQTSKKDGRQKGEAALSLARKHLAGYGFPEGLITEKIVSRGDEGETILEEARQGRYAAVAVGGPKGGQGFLSKILGGSVTNRLFRELEGAALWICH